MGPLLRLLRRIPGAEVVDLDAGCCGLAGSFGYETEHYEVSRQVGEHRLFPALREAGPDPIRSSSPPAFPADCRSATSLPASRWLLPSSCSNWSPIAAPFFPNTLGL